MSVVDNHIIKYPVSIADLQKLFQTTIDRIPGLCSLPTINKWARYKPVIVAGQVEMITHEQRKAVNYGITNIPSWGNNQQSIANMVRFWLLQIRNNSDYWPICDKLSNSVAGKYWLYTPPNGGSAQPSRILDYVPTPNDTTDPNYKSTDPNFDRTALGYQHDAEAPINPLQEDTFFITPKGQLNIPYFPSGAAAENWVQLSDLVFPGDSTQFSLDGYYFGVMLIKTSETNYTKAWGATFNKASVAITTATTGEGGEGGSTNLRFAFSTVASIDSFMGNGDSAEFYVAPFLANTGDSSYNNGYKAAALMNALTSSAKCVALLDRQTITIKRKYAGMIITRYKAYRMLSDDAGERQKYAIVDMYIKNREADASRTCNITVSLYNKNGEKQTLSSGTYASVPVGAGETVFKRFTIDVRGSGGSIWPSLEGGYFSVASTMAETTLILVKTVDMQIGQTPFSEDSYLEAI